MCGIISATADDGEYGLLLLLLLRLTGCAPRAYGSYFSLFTAMRMCITFPTLIIPALIRMTEFHFTRSHSRQFHSNLRPMQKRRKKKLYQ